VAGKIEGGRRYSYPENDCQTYVLECIREYYQLLREMLESEKKSEKKDKETSKN